MGNIDLGAEGEADFREQMEISGLTFGQGGHIFKVDLKLAEVGRKSDSEAKS